MNASHHRTNRPPWTPGSGDTTARLDGSDDLGPEGSRTHAVYHLVVEPVPPPAFVKRRARETILPIAPKELPAVVEAP